VLQECSIPISTIELETESHGKGGWLAIPDHPAVDWDHGSGHIIGQVGRKEIDHPGSILEPFRAAVERPTRPDRDCFGCSLEWADQDRRLPTRTSIRPHASS